MCDFALDSIKPETALKVFNKNKRRSASCQLLANAPPIHIIMHRVLKLNQYPSTYPGT